MVTKLVTSLTWVVTASDDESQPEGWKLIDLTVNWFHFQYGVSKLYTTLNIYEVKYAEYETYQ